LTDNHSQNQPKLNKIGFDNLLEDIFGLNIRALKTIGVMFRKPVDYFKAARTPEWEDKYTPSFRVWFGIMAILVALNFIYNNDKSAMTAAYQGMVGQLATQFEHAHNAANVKNGQPPDIIDVDIDKAAIAWENGQWSIIPLPISLSWPWLEFLCGFGDVPSPM